MHFYRLEFCYFGPKIGVYPIILTLPVSMLAPQPYGEPNNDPFSGSMSRRSLKGSENVSSRVENAYFRPALGTFKQ